MVGEDLAVGNTGAEQGSRRGEAGGHPGRATRQAALPRQSRDNMEPNTRKALSICKDDLI